MASAVTDRRSATPGRESPANPVETLVPAAAPEELTLAPVADREDLLDGPLATDLLADLDHPDLVLSEGYVGPERRARGALARLRRATFASRRSLLTLEFVIVALVGVVVAAVVLTGPGARPAPARSARASHHPAITSSPAAAVATPPTTPVTAAAPPVSAPTTTAPPTAAAPAAAPATPAPATPDQLGAQALTLVRYPWQQLPGYSIQFLPISEAPSPGFYGNTTFTWGHTGGTSVLYVFPGETVPQLAGIIAFEIAHEVDAAAVLPAGGEAQIENVLNYHPASWAPNCDCAEQDFLSGWYATAFSNYWSPGVGSWSRLPVAPPSGATLTEIAPWLNPAIP